MTAFLRAIKFGLQNVWRNFGLSITTISILVVMLMSVNLIFAISAMTGAAISSVKDQVDVSVFFTPDAPQSRIDEVQKVVGGFSSVKEAQLKSPEQVLVEFTTRHADSEAIQYSLKELGKNPLGATLIIRTYEPGQYRDIVKALNIPEYEGVIESRTFDDTTDIVSRIAIITDRAQMIAWVVTIIFAVIAFMIVASSIRVAIFTQREEISIQKLVGAGNWFIRAPFFVEVLLYCTLAMILAIVILYFGITVTDPYIRTLFGTYQFSLMGYFMTQGPLLFGAQFASLIVLCSLSGFMSMRRFLRV